MISEIFTFIITLFRGLLDIFKLALNIGENKKKIKVILQHREWVEALYLIITNHGVRPTTIIDFQVNEYNANGKQPFYQHAVLHESEEDNKLPIKLEESDTVEFRLSDILMDWFYNDEHNFTIEVRDSTGKIYDIDKVEKLDTKFNQKYDITVKYMKNIKKAQLRKKLPLN
jgi:hypothetical protein